MTDNKEDVIFEMDRDGKIIRSIDISNLKKPGELKSDAEGITWMYGTRFALVMEGGEEMAVLNINSATAQISRSQVSIFDLSGDPKGVSYKASEDALYWVSQTLPMRVVKAQLNEQQGKLNVVWNKNVDNLPSDGLSDIAIFPRLSPHIFLLSDLSGTVMEVDMSGDTAVLKSSFSFSSWHIPRPGGLAFDPDGSFRIVGKHAAGLPQDDFSVFVPTAPIPNRSPIADIGGDLDVIDFTGTGALVNIDSSRTIDVDGAIITYEWYVDTVLVKSGYGPRVPPLSRRFTTGLSRVALVVRDDTQATSQTSIEVNVRPFSGAPEDHPVETFPQPGGYPAVSLNYIHPGSILPRAEFLFELTETGFAEIYIYDQLGHEIKYFKTEVFPPGQYRAPCELVNSKGEGLASGAYFVLIKTPGRVKKDKLVVVQ